MAQDPQAGKPIIANDPHLAFTAPGKWYVVSIKSPIMKWMDLQFQEFLELLLVRIKI